MSSPCSKSNRRKLLQSRGVPWRYFTAAKSKLGCCFARGNSERKESATRRRRRPARKSHRVPNDRAPHVPQTPNKPMRFDQSNSRPSGHLKHAIRECSRHFPNYDARPFGKAILRPTLVLNLSSISADRDGTRDHKVPGDRFRLVALGLCLMKPRETGRENLTDT